MNRQAAIRAAVLAGHPFGVGRLRERWHFSGRSGTLRAAVFGVSDGLVSNLALILGVAGAGVSARAVVIAGIAGLLAGAFSMGAGEYLSMRVQREIFEHALEVEALELELLPDQEQEELAQLYRRKGLPEETARDVAALLMREPELALDAHAREEHGLDPEELGSPWGAAISSFLTFSIGALAPLIPYLMGTGNAAFMGSVLLGAGALATVGGFMAYLTTRSVWRGALRMLTIGSLAAAITFGIGSALGVTVG